MADHRRDKNGGTIGTMIPPFFVAAALFAIATCAANGKMQTGRLWLVTDRGEHPISVEIAATPEEQALGLMFRARLPEGQGMLFPYPSPREVTMWMKNTYIALDMVFIRADGVVHRIEPRAEPQSEKIIASNGPVTAVLEIAGGAAGRLGLKAGDRVRHPHFKDASKASP